MAQDFFYRDLPAFADFNTVGDTASYQPVPEDWVVLASDIVRSRDAIAAGRYKDVNMIAAAVISAVLNRVGRDKVPFVFGGDGAFLLVPASDAAAGKEALAGLARLARNESGLELRIAAIPVAHLRALGADILLRKYELGPDTYLAMAIGDGLELADRILKDPEAVTPFAIRIGNPPRPNLDGLSCRWEPLPSERGRIASLIVKPSRTVSGTVPLKEIQEGIREIVGRDPFGETNDGNHVTPSRLRFKFPPPGLSLEAGYAGANWSRSLQWLMGALQSLAFLVSYKTGLTIGPLNRDRYLKEISRQTDHRKLDDSLRLVLDLTVEQLASLKTYLETAFANGRLVFGLHETDSALMTCFVSDLGASRHVHFIDGADGGLSMAATDFKQRLASRSTAL
ncbi:DUF3095 domain-containing protein [Labrenzia suaedae]|uniref:DUF3095 domain-containing protein n=2 Tax=Roseibium litorale TaxID=2803841 RepID=A0ABR9CQG6_9HYPH|nr:DUF3095 domain-containing protein [Roseibium litorale]